LNGSHATAYSDPDFQEAWKAAGSPGECLKCHTSGYDETTGTYAFEGIVCEVCHGAGMHPIPGGAPTSLNASTCGECHTGKERPFIDEWRLSKHAVSLKALESIEEECLECHTEEMGINNLECLSCHSAEIALAVWEGKSVGIEDADNPITCSVCHDPHETSIRIEPSSELCAKCHVGQHALWSEDSPHGLLGIECETCHRYTVPFNETLAEMGLPGHEATKGHTFKILKDEEGKPLVCANCHGVITGILSYEGSIEAMRRIQKRISSMAEETRLLIEIVKGEIELANKTEGIDPLEIKKAYELWLNAYHIFVIDVERSYSKGFHNPTGMAFLIEEVLRNVSKAQRIVLEARVKAFESILNTTAGKVDVLTENMRIVSEDLATLRDTLDILTSKYMVAVDRLTYMVIINIIVLVAVLLSIIIPRFLRRE
jgi:hypothetical protein